MRVTGASSDVNIVAGDFNTEDFSLGYEVALVNAGLKDAWKKCINQDTKVCKRGKLNHWSGRRPI